MKIIPTVSQVINSSRSPERLEFLSKWRERNLDSIRESGNNFHQNVQDYILRGAIPKEEDNFFRNIFPYIENYKSSGLEMLVEKSFLCDNPYPGYRGRIDLLFDDTLYEFKTRNKDSELHPDSLHEYLMQLAAYANAFSSKIEDTCLVLVYPFHNRKPDFLFYTKEYLNTYFNLFIKYLGILYIKNEIT